MLPDIFSLQGIARVYETIDHVRKSCNPKLGIGGVLVNRYNKRSRLHKEVYGTAQLIAGKLGIPVFKTVIRNCVSLSESQSLQCDVTSTVYVLHVLRTFRISLLSLLKEEFFSIGVIM